jgi:translation initiation factor IF-2
MEQVRVNELASEFEMRSTAVILELKKIGVWVPSPETPVDFDIANRIRRRLQLVIDTEEEEQARAVKAKVKKRPSAKPRKTIKQLGQPRKAASPSAEAVDSPFLMGSLRPRKGKGNYRRIVTEPLEAVLEKTEVTIEDEPIIERVEAQISAELLEQAQRMVLSRPAPLASTSLPLLPPGTVGPVAPPPASAPPATEGAVEPARAEAPAPELPDEVVEVTAASEVETPAVEAPEVEPQPAEAVKGPEGPAVITVSDSVTVRDLSEKLGVKSKVLIKELFSRGVMATINRSLDRDTIQQLCDIFDAQVEFVSEQEALVQEEHVVERPEDVQARAPVVTVMGHVDHGKTSLLDAIRESRVAASEAGGITQHIGAYHVELENGRVVTFLDTPGHEAFTAMRARGAQVTDVVVLVVAADDSVMPQTLEAIDHARAANVPIALAINKIDLPAANPDRIKRQLTEHNIVVEEFGGKVQCCEVSASTGQDVNELLELLALETDLLELKANPESRVKGTIIEARLDRGRGNVATVLIQSGTLRVGDPFITGLYSGRVRAMLDERGNPVGAAGPSVPVQVLGLDGLPQAGDLFHVVPNDRQARELSQRRQQLRRERDVRRGKRMSLVDIRDQIQAGKIQELRLILKADVDGSVEALHDALSQISSEEVKLNVIHRGVGAISESDVLLASASDAVIIGFNIRPDARGREVATREGVDIWLYRVIYEAVEDIKAALSGLLAPKVDEHILGSAEIRETFQVSRFGTIAGCYVDSGAIRRDSRVRVLRDNAVVFEGQLASLKRFKDDVREVQSGFECGMRVENFNDIKIGDTIEAYEMVETARSL